MLDGPVLFSAPEWFDEFEISLCKRFVLFVIVYLKQNNQSYDQSNLNMQQTYAFQSSLASYCRPSM